MKSIANESTVVLFVVVLILIAVVVLGIAVVWSLYSCEVLWWKHVGIGI